jgi:DNA-binding GntR family transcriptional regulator
MIKSKIPTREFSAGEQPPVDKDLCETYQVSILTARQAMLNLGSVN